MKFSIIVPVYNVERYLDKCLDSIVNQTYKDYEVIIVCDKCEDNSEKIVNKYVKKNKDFIKIYAENTGLSIARNLGVAKASGDYILFLDSDDYVDAELLNTLNKNIKDEELIRFQARTVCNNEINEYPEKNMEIKPGIEAFKDIINFHFVENSWLYCYKKDFYLANKFKFAEHRIAEDYGLIPLIIYKAKSLKVIDYIGYNYNIRENSLMTNDNYKSKIKKMDDMIYQANELKKIIKDENLLLFINNSLIYYSTALKKDDYKKYIKTLKKDDCFKTLKGRNIKGKIRVFLIKTNAYFAYNYIFK